MMDERFQQMAKAAHKSEELVCSFLEWKHSLGFFITPHDEQKNGTSKGWHVPDIQCSNRLQTTIEVKEDMMCSKTGNIAFEEDGLVRLKRWAEAHNKPNMFLAYVNHLDFGLDVFKVGLDVDYLIKELEWICVFRPDCKVVQGGDQGLKLWIIPIKVARTLQSCVNNSLFTKMDMVAFRIIAKNKLAKE
jgi:hypothetical protein